MTVDPSSPKPKYYQMRDILMGIIDVEQLPVDTPIPPERELSERYGISRMTVRQAIDILVDEGRLYRVPGRGVFVARAPVQVAPQLVSFTQDIRARGMRPASEILDAGTMVAPPYVSRPLQLAEGATVHFLERVRMADGEPMAIERTHVPTAMAPGLLNEPLIDESLLLTLDQRYGHHCRTGELVVAAGLADARLARVLHVHPGSAVLHVRRRSDADAGPVEYTIATFRGDRYELRAPLGSDGGGVATLVAQHRETDSPFSG